MASEVSICNMALLSLGKSTIALMNERTPEALACKTFFSHTRDFLLSLHPWNFATKRVTLAEVSDVTSDEYDYIYSYPSDCLRALRLVNTSSDALYEYEVSTHESSNARYIMCDYESAVLVYIARIEDVNMFSPTFIETFRYKLALDVGQTLTADSRRMAELGQVYQISLQAAMGSDGREGVQPVRTENQFYDARA